MAVDYDVVILGGTQEGYTAAQHAAQLGARAAWVLQGQYGRRSPLVLAGTIWKARVPPPLTKDSRRVLWKETLQQARLAAETLTDDDFQDLMMQGVDVIAERAQQISESPLTVTTRSRQLTTRAVLLATGHLPRLPDLPGLATATYETPETLLQCEHLPTSALVLGSAPLGLMLCQILSRWQVPVTLLSPVSTLLPQEDPAMAQWITAQLSADGVVLRLGATIEAIKAVNSGHSLQLAGSERIEAETLVVATGTQPNLAGIALQLASEVKPVASKLSNNRYLQCRHPRIYGCGSVLGGYGMAAIAAQEAKVAVENALFWNRRPIDYCTLPYDLMLQPEMARVGLTEPQARRRYSSEDLLISYQRLYDTPKAQWLAATRGGCKLIAHRNGQILGAHGVGPEASEWIQTIGLLMAQRMRWWDLTRQSTLSHSLTYLLGQAIQHWDQERWQPGRWRRDWAENWFNWRRSR